MRMTEHPPSQARRRDPRLYQIAVLGCLLTYGVGWLDFSVSVDRIVLTLATCLATQYLCTRLWALPRFDPRSPLISGLSLCLLLRTDLATLVVATAVVTVASKFLLRVDNRHLFNPTNFGLVAMMMATGQVWVSPGQWGSLAFFAFLLAGLGGLVVHRAARSDVTYAFLGLYALLVIGRAVWLGDPLAIPLHHLQSGSLLLFAFFMISDPKTTPDSRAGRVLFAGLVALGAVLVQFGLHRPNGLLWSLATVAPLTPIINRLLPGARYDWHRPVANAARSPLQKGLTTMTLFHPTTVHRTARIALVSLAAWLCAAPGALAFCGFYVTKADTTLFNRASKVVLARDGDRTVVTMANDFQGDPTEFAVVIPVPTLLTRGQIHVGDQAVIDHLDAYTAPRLVEYFGQHRWRNPLCLAAGSEAPPMGQRAPFAERREVTGRVIGTAPIESIALYKNDELVWQGDYLTDTAAGSTRELLLSFQSDATPYHVGDAPRGWRHWRGTLTVEGARLEAIADTDFVNPSTQRLEQDGNTARFATNTRGDTSSLRLTLSRVQPDAAIALDFEDAMETGSGPPSDRVHQMISGSQARLRVRNLDGGRLEHPMPIEGYADGIVLRGIVTDGPRDLSFNYTDDDDPRHGDYYYVRVRQTNDAMAWSSPVWVGGYPSR